MPFNKFLLNFENLTSKLTLPPLPTSLNHLIEFVEMMNSWPKNLLELTEENEHRWLRTVLLTEKDLATTNFLGVDYKTRWHFLMSSNPCKIKFKHDQVVDYRANESEGLREKTGRRMVAHTHTRELDISVNKRYTKSVKLFNKSLDMFQD